MTGQTRPRGVLLLENPRSGQPDSNANTFRDVLEAQGVNVTTRHLEAEVACSDYLKDAEAYDAVVAAGGDGTVSSVAYALRGRNVPMLAYPAGTANLIAQNLALPTDPHELADVLLAGHTVRTDLAEIETDGGTHGFTLIAGAGADAEMIKESEELKGKYGVAAYVISAMKQLAPKRVEFELDIDGRKISTDGMSVLIANFGMANFRIPVASGIDPTDGRLSIVVLKGRTALSLIPMLIDGIRQRLNLGDPMFEGNLETYEGRRIRITADQELPIQYDGETVEGALPMEARILPGAARFLTLGSRADVTT